jgi:glycerol dehydrogenase-like iron-containing ADH family enzyme
MPAARRPGAVLALPTIPSQCAIRSPRRPSPCRDGGVLAPPTFRLSRAIRMLRAPLAQLLSLMRSLPAESHYVNDGIFDGQLDMYCASEISL